MRSDRDVISIMKCQVCSIWPGECCMFSIGIIIITNQVNPWPIHHHSASCRAPIGGMRYFQLSDWLGMPALRLSDGSLCHLLSLIPSLRDPETSCSALASSCGQSLHVELKPQTSRKRKAVRNCQGWLLSSFLSVVISRYYFFIPNQNFRHSGGPWKTSGNAMQVQGKGNLNQKRSHRLIL